MVWPRRGFPWGPFSVLNSSSAVDLESGLDTLEPDGSQTSSQATACSSEVVVSNRTATLGALRPAMLPHS